MKFLTKSKIAAAGLVVAGILTLLWRESMLEARHAVEGAQPASEDRELQGTWLLDSATLDGTKPEKQPGADNGPFTPDSRWVFSGGKVTLQIIFHQAQELSCRLDPKKDPKTIDLVRGEDVLRGIYRVEKDTLTLCFLLSPKPEDRPKEFRSERKTGLVLLTLKRVRSEKPGELSEAALKFAKKVGDSRLSQILLAFRNYEQEQGRLPAAAICNSDGKPLLSWRVAILKHLGCEDLLKQFNLNEPWDSEHNKKSLANMPAPYLPLWPDAAKPYTTAWQVFVGKGTLFEGKDGMQLKDIQEKGKKDFGKTILCAEGAEPVLWTKPDDLAYAADKPLPKLGGHYPTGFWIGMLDGKRYFVKTKFDEKILRLAILRNDEGAFDPEDLLE